MNRNRSKHRGIEQSGTISYAATVCSWGKRRKVGFFFAKVGSCMQSTVGRGFMSSFQHHKSLPNLPCFRLFS